jgi:hypothetical protein
MATDTTTNPTPEENTQKPDAFLTTIQKQLLDQSGIISSTSSELETRLSKAMAGVKSSAESSNKAIESEFGREFGYASEQGNLAVQNQLEGRSGFATNLVALRNLVETTDKSLKDMAQRKEELILQNNSQAASKIAELELSAVKFRQDAQQQVFANLLGMSNFALQKKSSDLADKSFGLQERSQSFQEKQAINNVALQYGLTVNEGDTLESIVTKAMPLASKQKQLELARTQAEINNLKAQTNKVIRGDGTSSALSDPLLQSLAESAMNLKNAGRVDEYNNIVAQVTKGGQSALDKFYNNQESYQAAALATERQAAQDKIDAANAKKSAKKNTFAPLGTNNTKKLNFNSAEYQSGLNAPINVKSLFGKK